MQKKLEEKMFFDMMCVNLGLGGIIVRAEIECVKNFKLLEKVYAFNTLEATADGDKSKCLTPEKLAVFMNECPYFTLMLMPTYDETNSTPILQVRTSKFAGEKAEVTVEVPTYSDNNPKRFVEEFVTTVGSTVGEMLQSSVMNGLTPELMAKLRMIIRKLANHHIIGDKKEYSRVGWERTITHPNTNYPNADDIVDVSLLSPVKESKAPGVLHNILKKMAKELLDFGKQGKYPINDGAVYTRYFQGTQNGFLSTSACNKDERILALEMVSDFETPEYKEYLGKGLEILKEQGIDNPRYHHGKNNPFKKTLRETYGDKAVDALINTLEKFHGKPLKQIPFLTPYHLEMLSPKPKQVLTQEAVARKDEFEIKRQDETLMIATATPEVKFDAKQEAPTPKRVVSKAKLDAGQMLEKMHAKYGETIQAIGHGDDFEQIRQGVKQKSTRMAPTSV